MSQNLAIPSRAAIEALAAALIDYLDALDSHTEDMEPNGDEEPNYDDEADYDNEPQGETPRQHEPLFDPKDYARDRNPLDRHAAGKVATLGKPFMTDRGVFQPVVYQGHS